MNLLAHPEIALLCETLRRNAAEKRYRVSDLIVEKGGGEIQYVDLVMEGGGTLGIALVGYLYALEQAGIRFLSVGGSSVGAVVALLLAAMDDRDEQKGERLAELISEMNMAAFIDGGLFAGALSRLLGSGKAGSKPMQVAVLALLSMHDLCERLGLNPGDRFLAWLTDCLEDFGVHVYDDMRARVEQLPESLMHRERGMDFIRPKPSLKIVAADLTTSTKVIFPEMAELYWQDVGEIHPALFARASMSVPLFFQPMTVSGVSTMIDAGGKWENLGAFSGRIPDRITFADGGLLSNFPISLFHQNRMPNAPTFGARLGSRSRVVKEIDSLGEYGAGMFNALRHYSDYDFIYQNPDYRQLITHIPTEGHNWLNFSMTDAEKLDLFYHGMRAAFDFLQRFDWQYYKEMRRLHMRNGLVRQRG